MVRFWGEIAQVHMVDVKDSESGLDGPLDYRLFALEAQRQDGLRDAEIKRLDQLAAIELQRRQDEKSAAAELRISEQRARASEAALVRVAQDKFETTVGARFVQQNEFRDSLDDLGKNMATHVELATAIAPIRDVAEKNATSLEKMLAVQAGEAGQAANIRNSQDRTRSFLLGIAALVISVSLLFSSFWTAEHAGHVTVQTPTTTTTAP